MAAVFIVCSCRSAAQTLVASYSFNGNANDATGNGHNGTVYGATTTDDRFGNPNSAYRFDGVSNYIQVPSASDLNFNTQGAISAWVKYCGPLPYRTHSALIAGKPYDTTGSYIRSWREDDGYALGIYGGQPGLGSFGSTSSAFYGGQNTAPSIVDGKWHHLVEVIHDTLTTYNQALGQTNNVTCWEFYLDGQKYDFTDNSHGINCCGRIEDMSNNTLPLYIGLEPYSSSYFNCAIDDIQIYRGRVYSAQVQALYSAGGWPNVTLTINFHVNGLTPTSICPGGSAQLQASFTGTQRHFRWMDAPGLNPADSVNPSPTVHPQITTTYSAIATIGSPCPNKSDTEKVTIVVNEAPNPFAGGQVYLCRGDTVQLAAGVTAGTQPFHYSWSPPATMDNASTAKPNVWPSSSTRYFVTVTDANGCVGRDSVLVTVYDPPPLAPSPDITICRGSPARLGNAGIAQMTYHWSPAGGLSDTALAQPLANPDTTTTYYLTVTSPAGCKARDTVVVKVNPAAIAHAGPGATICQDSSKMIGTAAQAGYTYAWAPPTGLNNPTIAQPVAKPDSTTTYHLAARNASGCTATDSVTVTVLRLQLATSSATLDFGQLDGCTSSKDMTVWIKNSGSSAGRIDSAASSAGFSLVSPSLPASLQAGDSVQATVRFAPTLAGNANGKLVLAGSPCSIALSIALSGGKQQSLVSASTGAINFGASLACATVDTSSVITISNNGTSPTTIGTSIVAAPFSVSSPSLPANIPPNGTRALTVRYAPAVAGTFNSDLKLPYASGSCQDTLRIALSGLHEQPVLSATAASMDFGTVSGCATQADTTISLSNSGTYDITIDSASIPAGYKILTPLPFVIHSGGSLPLPIRFLPATSGTVAGPMILSYSPCKGSLTIALTGTKQGVAFALTDTLSFGQLISCQASSKSIVSSLTFSGDSGTSGSISAVTVSGPFTSTLNSGTVLPNGSAFPFNANFTPLADGASTGSIDLTLEPCGITRHIILTGSRVTPALTAAPLSFGPQKTGTPVSKELDYINTGTTSLTVSNIDGILPPYTLSSSIPAVPSTLAPGDTLKVIVAYTPVQGVSSSPINAAITAPCVLSSASMLSGTGILAAVPHYVWFDTLLAPAGIPFTLTAHVAPPIADSENITGFSLQLLYSGSALFANKVNDPAATMNILTLGLVDVQKTSPTPLHGDRLFDMTMTGLITGSDRNRVLIDSVSFTGGATPTHGNGLVLLTGCELGKAGFSKLATIDAVLPNPAHDEIVVRYTAPAGAESKLVIMSLLGAELESLPLPPGTAEQQEVRMSVARHASGLYMLELRNGGERMAVPVVITK